MSNVFTLLYVAPDAVKESSLWTRFQSVRHLLFHLPELPAYSLHLHKFGLSFAFTPPFHCWKCLTLSFSQLSHRNEWERPDFQFEVSCGGHFPVRNQRCISTRCPTNDSSQLNSLQGEETLDAKLRCLSRNGNKQPSLCLKTVSATFPHRVPFLHAYSTFVSTLLKYWYEQIIYEHKRWIVLFKILELCCTVFSALHLQRTHRGTQESCVGFLNFLT